MENSFEQLQELYERAMAGDAKAMLEFVQLNYVRRNESSEVIASPEEEFNICFKSAESGNVHAYKMLGVFWLWGDNIEKDYKKACEYLLKAYSVGYIDWIKAAKIELHNLKVKYNECCNKTTTNEELSKIAESIEILSLLIGFVEKEEERPIVKMNRKFHSDIKKRIEELSHAVWDFVQEFSDLSNDERSALNNDLFTEALHIKEYMHIYLGTLSEEERTGDIIMVCGVRKQIERIPRLLENIAALEFPEAQEDIEELFRRLFEVFDEISRYS